MTYGSILILFNSKNSSGNYDNSARQKDEITYLINSIHFDVINCINNTKNVNDRIYMIDSLYPSYIHLSAKQVYDFLFVEEHPCILDGVIDELIDHLSVFDYFDYSQNDDISTYKIVDKNKKPMLPTPSWILPHTNPIIVLFHEGLVSERY